METLQASHQQEATWKAKKKPTTKLKRAGLVIT